MNTPVMIPSALDAKTVEWLLERLQKVSWQEGTKTAGPVAGQVKRNLQADEDQTKGLRESVVRALLAHTLFRSIVRPSAVALMFSRYQNGDEYGLHVDDAVMGPPSAPMRRDVSFTIFLTPASNYKGGELIIESPFEDRPYKFSAGSMVVYPSTALHRVTPITEGERIVVVGWARSLIRDPAKRELLFELDAVKSMMFANYGKTTEVDLLSRCSANLMRMWMED